MSVSIHRPAILLVDDHAPNLDAMRLLLSAVDADCVTASSGAEALAILLERSFALVLLDVDMPDMDGYEVARYMKGADVTRLVPIVFLTAAYQDERHRIEGYQCGGVDYLEKPINDIILLSKVRTFLDLWRKSAELIESERRQALIMRTAQDLILITDPQGRIELVNVAATHLLGYAEEELLTHTLEMLMVEADLPRLPQHLEQLQTSAYEISEWRFKHKNGGVRLFELGIQQLPDDRLLTIGRDVTERKKAEEEFIKKERKYRLLLESANDAILVADADTGIILEANRAAENLLGRPISEIVGLHQTTIHPPEEAAYYAQLFHEHVQHQRDTVDNVVVMRADGSRVPVEIRAAVTGIGNQRFILGIFRDVTERRKAEETLRMSQQILATAQTIAQLGKWVWDLDTDRLECSSEVYYILGRDPLARITTFEELLTIADPQDRPQLEKAIQQTLIEPHPPYDIEHRILRSDGTSAYVHQRGILILDKDGRLDRIMGTVQDVTAHKIMEMHLQNMNKELEYRVEQRTRELERSNQDLQQFAYVASHDLKEPLRLVAGFVQLLERRYSGKLDDKATQYIQYVVDGVRQMDALIESLLSYARVGSQNEPLARVNAETILNRTLRYLGHQIEEQGATITMDPLPMVMAHEGQLTQVFQNLVGNAIKFHADRPPTIHISCCLTETEDEWLFSVRDNGIGIDVQYAERIFVIFQKLHARSSYEGTGIGLALCKRIVERHGGRIWMESTLGAGSTFYFTLPKEVPEVGTE